MGDNNKRRWWRLFAGLTALWGMLLTAVLIPKLFPLSLAATIVTLLLIFIILPMILVYIAMKATE